MIRTFDAEKIKSVLHHPDILPNIGNNQHSSIPIDLSHHYLWEEGVLFVFHPYRDAYQVHVNIIKNKRNNSLELGFEAMKYAKKIGNKFVTFVPKEFPNVADYTEALGLTRTDKGDHWRFDMEF